MMRVFIQGVSKLPFGNKVSLFLASLLLSAASLAPALGQSSEKDAPAPKMETFEGQITNADAFDTVRTNSHQRSHFMRMAPGYTYIIEMSARFDTYLRVEDSTGKHLATIDDFNGRNSYIFFAPKKEGVYRIIATTFRPGETGFYTVTIRPAKSTDASKVVLRLQGQLTKNDPPDAVRKDCHHRVHTVKMEAGKTYVLFSATQTYDGYLRLEDDKAKRLTENDDYRDTRHSRIVFTPPKTGNYRTIVTTFSPGSTGSYSLSVYER